MEKLLKDGNTMVLGSAVAAFTEVRIHHLLCTQYSRYFSAAAPQEVNCVPNLCKCRLTRGSRNPSVTDFIRQLHVYMPGVLACFQIAAYKLTIFYLLSKPDVVLVCGGRSDGAGVPKQIRAAAPGLSKAVPPAGRRG